MTKSYGGILVKDLYLALGLDLDSLDGDFIEAERSVRDNVRALKAEVNREKIQLSIDTNNLKMNGQEARQFQVAEESLTKQFVAQQQVVALLNLEYQRLVAAKGQNDAASKRQETGLLREQKMLSDLGAKLADTKKQAQALQTANITQGKNNSGIMGFFTNIGNKITGAKEGVLGFLAVLHPVTAVLKGIKEGIAGILSMAGEAAQVGENIYRLSARMRTTTEETVELSRVFRMAGVDSDTAGRALVRLEKSLVAGGEAGDKAKRALDFYGVSLTDATGKLLPMNQQLEQLAQGYQEAAKSGQQEEYIVQTLGTRGLAMLPVLQQFFEIRQKLNGLEGPSLDIDGAHDMTLELGKLNEQWLSMKVYMGAALMPLAKEIIPEITDGLATMLRMLKEADASLPGIGAFYKTIKEITSGGVYDLTGELGRLGAFKEIYEKNKAEIEAANMKIKADQELRKSHDKTTKETLAAADARKKKEEEVAKAVKTINDELYKSSHTDLENQIHDIDKKTEALRKQGVDEETIAKYAEANKAKIIEDFNKNTMDKINSIYNTALENRLHDIEREKEAYRQKGVSEVESAKWAEQQKLDAVRNAALEAIKSDRKRLEQVREAMKQQNNGTTGYGIDEQGNRVEFNFKHGNAMDRLAKQWVTEDRAANNIAPGETFSPELIQAYERMKKYTSQNLIPGLEAGGNLSQAMGNAGQQAAASIGKQVNVASPSITVEVNNPVVRNDSDISEIADKVADKIQPAILQALGGTNNGY